MSPSTTAPGSAETQQPLGGLTALCAVNPPEDAPRAGVQGTAPGRTLGAGAAAALP